MTVNNLTSEFMLHNLHLPAIHTEPSFFLRCFSTVIIIGVTVLHYSLRCPSNLRHLKRVSPYSTLLSYALREPVNQRIQRLILPFAAQGEAAVAVYMLGKWGVHIVDPKVIRDICSDMDRFPKRNYQEHLHFTFLSGPNVVFANGEMWKRHSASVRSAFDRYIPIRIFVELAQDLFSHIGGGGVVPWSKLIQQYTLDVVGKAALGHEFNSMAQSPSSEIPFIDHFNRVMASIATPWRLMFPILDRLLPRTHVMQDLASLNARYDALLEHKRAMLGDDILSRLLEDASLSREELRSNLSILFSAGHDTTSGAISTAVYFLAASPELQARARAEVLSALSTSSDPTTESIKRMSLLDVVVKEALRINPPIALLPARTCNEAAVVLRTTGGTELVLPGGVPIVPNIYAVHHNPMLHESPQTFDPSRFTTSPNTTHHARRGGKRLAAAHGAFLPFGSGPRQCPARQFSLYEQKTLLAMLLVRYNWRLPNDSPHRDGLVNEFGAFGLSIPHDLSIQFERESGCSDGRL